MVGLYPWGRLPLVLGVLLALFGWFVSGSASRFRIAVGLLASLFVLSLPLLLLGDSMRIALDILE